ncbi:DUF3429 domain-containing protein [Pseudovibrio flavus]|uniref:DUF3429 domain-containing protein n=1 Tax=Pseudovibrio flavus TaxID=2529854 RepID=UPI00211BB2D9|nr:DUF3429 domain-containing protein [Pseudovibrio flavus]
MKGPHINLFDVLAYAGTLPFIFCAGALSMGYTELPHVGTLHEILASYTLMILTFMAGTHWGEYIAGNVHNEINLLVTSNVIALGGWILFLLAPPYTFFIGCIALFITLLWIEWTLHRHKLIGFKYFRMRITATAIVTLSLLVAAFAP